MQKFTLFTYFLFAGIFLGFSQKSPLDTLKSKEEKIKIEKNLRDTSKNFNFIWDREYRRHLVKINVPGIFALTGSLAYEVNIYDRLSLQLGVFAGNYSLGNTIFQQYGGFFEPKIYLLGKACRGLYVSPFVKYRYLPAKASITYNDTTEVFYTAKANTISAGLTIGYQWVWGNWFVVNPFAGATYNSHRLRFDGTAQPDYFNFSWLGMSQFSFRWGVYIGLAFK